MLDNNRSNKQLSTRCETVIAAPNNEGFTLIEVMIAFVIVMVAMLGVFQAFTYSISYNSANKTRGQALTVMQEEVELLRSKKFTPGYTDPDLTGGIHTKTVALNDGPIFTVEDTIDNDPLVAGVQPETYTCLSPQGTAIPCAIKEITVSVRLAAPYPGWQNSIPAIAVLRRTRGN